jgi:hypothetical protein
MNDWDRAYLDLGRSKPDQEPAERRRQDLSLYLIAALALVVLAAVI